MLPVNHNSLPYYCLQDCTHISLLILNALKGPCSVSKYIVVQITDVWIHPLPVLQPLPLLFPLFVLLPTPISYPTACPSPHSHFFSHCLSFSPLYLTDCPSTHSHSISLIKCKEIIQFSHVSNHLTRCRR